MPIDFACTQCDQLLQTPDVSARKKIRCPSCTASLFVPSTSQIAAVPSTQAFAEPADVMTSPHGVAASFVDPGAAHSGDAAISSNPYAAPSPSASYSDGVSDAPLPWDTERRSIQTFWISAKSIMFSPVDVAKSMNVDGGYWRPLMFAVVGTFVGAFFATLYNAIVRHTMLAFFPAGELGEAAVFPAWFAGGTIAVDVVMVFVLAPLGAVITTFINAAFIHVVLVMVKGARYEFEATFRVVAYVAGATSLLNIIPLVGGIAGIVAIVYMIVMLSPIHKTDQWRSVVAVLIPMLIGVVVGCGILAAIFTALGVAVQSGAIG